MPRVGQPIRVETAITIATRKPRAVHEVRTCSFIGCTTKLNRYNKDERCHSHQPRKRPRIRGSERPPPLARCGACAARGRGRLSELIEVEFDGVIHREGMNGEGTLCESSPISARKQAS